jgi:trans-aconitate methyltransferase
MTTWNPAEYARSSDTQRTWAEELLSRLNLTGNEVVLDLGCGDGKITAALAQALPAGRAVGIDSSKEMIQYAQSHYPNSDYQNLVFRLLDVRRLDYASEFNLVFSNAALHWVRDHRAVLTGAHGALRPRGQLALSFGGKGNAAAMLEVGFAIGRSLKWREYFQGLDNPYSFYSPEEYRAWLDEAGFIIKRVELIPKDMVHRGPAGLASWIRTTWMPITSMVPEAKREDFVQDFTASYMESFPPDSEGNIHVRMVRLEVEAAKP